MTVPSFIRNSKKQSAHDKNQKGSNTKDQLTANTTKCCKISNCSKISHSQSALAFYRHIFADSDNEPLTVPQKLVINVVRDNLCDKDKRSKAIPRLPMVIPKLLRSLRDPESSVKDYVEIINKDPVMSAAVLKLANSVYFNTIGDRIGDIERAIVKLGIDGLRSVLSAAVMQPIIQRDSPYFTQTGQRLWKHSLNTAVACEVIGHSRRLERFKVYLLGLVHDIGKITLFSELCKQYKLNGDQIPGANAFIPPMNKLSAQVSFLIARDWQLPNDICIALKEQIEIKPGTLVTPYGQVLFQANIATEAYSFMPKSKRKALKYMIEDFKLPENIFAKLKDLSTEI